jgi:FkbM family methyltransferase
MEFLEQFPGGRFHCFDPEPRALVKFQKKITDGRVVLWNVALSDRDGVTKFYQTTGKPPGERWKDHDGDWDMSGSIQKPTGHLDYSPWTKFPQLDSSVTEYWAATIRLDTWAEAYYREMPTISLIWCDPQGAQAKIIRGGRKVLANTRWFYTEYAARGELYEGEPGVDELVKLLPEFELVSIYGGENLLFKNKRLVG